MFLEIHCKIFDPQDRKIIFPKILGLLSQGEWVDKFCTCLYVQCCEHILEPYLASQGLKFMNSREEILEPSPLLVKSKDPFALMIFCGMQIQHMGKDKFISEYFKNEDEFKGFMSNTFLAS